MPSQFKKDFGGTEDAQQCYYLPMRSAGVPVLIPVGERLWRADNSILGATNPGIAFRSQKDLSAKIPNEVLLWDSEIDGIEDGDDWVKCLPRSPAVSSVQRETAFRSGESALENSRLPIAASLSPSHGLFPREVQNGEDRDVSSPTIPAIRSFRTDSSYATPELGGLLDNVFSEPPAAPLPRNLETRLDDLESVVRNYGRKEQAQERESGDSMRLERRLVDVEAAIGGLDKQMRGLTELLRLQQRGGDPLATRTREATAFSTARVIPFYSDEPNSEFREFSNFYRLARPYEYILPSYARRHGFPDAMWCSFSEKAIMAVKAALMGDLEAWYEIDKVDNPMSVKALGRGIKNFDDRLWNEHLEDVAFDVVRQKFEADANCRQVLLSTGDAIIAYYGAPNDGIWGIGLPANDGRAYHPDQWLGRNVLGYALMKVREHICANPASPAMEDEQPSAIASKGNLASFGLLPPPVPARPHAQAHGRVTFVNMLADAESCLLDHQAQDATLDTANGSASSSTRENDSDIQDARPMSYSQNRWSELQRSVSEAAASLMPLLEHIQSRPDTNHLSRMLFELAKIEDATLAFMSGMSRSDCDDYGPSMASLSLARGSSMRKSVVAPQRSTRSNFVRTLQEYIGERPKRDWKTEWLPLNMEAVRQSEISKNGICNLSEEELERKARSFLIDPESPNKDELMMSNDPNDLMAFKLAKYGASLEDGKTSRINMGWPPECAETHLVLSGFLGGVLARDLLAGEKRFAASMYALTDAISHAAVFQAEQGVLPPPMYVELQGGSNSAAAKDDRFLELEEPDVFGFRGFTCAAEVMVRNDPRQFPGNGREFHLRDLNMKGEVTYRPVPSDVLCIISREPEDNRFHSVIQVSDQGGRVPPNTLFRLEQVRQPGTWETDTGIRPKCKCLEVSITYLVPRTTAHMEHPEDKLLGSTRELSFANRAAYVRGIQDLIATLPLSMEQEWQRADKWKARDGIQYSSRAEWAYVTGRAGQGSNVPNLGTSTFAGHRDIGDHAGLTPEDFVKRMRHWIQQRATHLDIELTEDAFLTYEEVLSIRLYTGPGYQPVNTWLRNIGKLDDALRVKLARSPSLTYAATVKHISSAIRKLARLNLPKENSRTLWRGVTGELPHNFWYPDAAGFVCMTELAFLSTSVEQETPLNYMRPGENLLLELSAGPEDDAFHCGADVSFLSQHAQEKEVLFPALTMLQVLPRRAGISQAMALTREDTSKALSRWMTARKATTRSRGSDAFRQRVAALEAPWDVQYKEANHTAYKHILVRPSFV